MVLVAGASSLYPKILGSVVDALGNLPNAPQKHIWLNLNAMQMAIWGPVIVIIVSIVRGVAWYLSTVATNRAALLATTHLQNDLFTKLLSLDYSRIIKEQSGAFSARFLNDVNAIREAVLKVTNSLVRDVLTIVGLLFAMFEADWQLAIVSVVVLPIAIYPINLIGTRLRKIAGQSQEQAGQLAGVIEESLGGIRLVKTYAMERTESARVSASLSERMRILFRAVEQKGRIDPILELLGGFAIAGVLAFAAYRINQGGASIGDLMSFIAALLMISGSIRSLGNMNTIMQEGVAGLNRFYAILDEEPAIKDKTGAIALDKSVGNVEFKNVGFDYEGQMALSKISFVAKNGQTIALVGASGSGKSTIINLVPRLFDVGTGEVKIDGHDVRDLTLASLRNAIALVSQDAIIFEASIRENVSFGTIDKTDAEIEAALRKAACDFVFKLPEGINAMIGPRGASLSGGERQRISLARAILRDAPILLLDEPTSALDSENEAKIAKSLAEFCKNRTTLVVAHRLSTVRGADKILVLSQGKIAESGTHNELIAKNGLYAELAKLQLSRNGK
ncbi:MAG: ABC transporter-like protein [Hyphomonadaceae bacterium]|nr:MAG: ABC transporter-like protein [Hyphomonadaceae bacterium]